MPFCISPSQSALIKKRAVFLQQKIVRRWYRDGSKSRTKYWKTLTRISGFAIFQYFSFPQFGAATTRDLRYQLLPNLPHNSRRQGVYLNFQGLITAPLSKFPLRAARSIYIEPPKVLRARTLEKCRKSSPRRRSGRMWATLNRAWDSKEHHQLGILTSAH